MYCSPRIQTADFYARPTHVFGDKIMDQVCLAIYVDEKRATKVPAGGEQWIVPAESVYIKAVYFRQNAAMGNGQERVWEWCVQHEALPPDADNYPEPFPTTASSWMASADNAWGERNLVSSCRS